VMGYMVGRRFCVMLCVTFCLRPRWGRLGGIGLGGRVAGRCCRRLDECRIAASCSGLVKLGRISGLSARRRVSVVTSLF
jgi:hypothetical protein